MRELRSHLGRHRPTRIDPEAEKRAGWQQHGILVIAEQDPRLTSPEREMSGSSAKSSMASGRRTLDEQADRGAFARSAARANPRAGPERPQRGPSRTVDTLGKMLPAGTISQEMHDAARAFQAAFANLDQIRAAPILRRPGAGREPELNERQLDMSRRVHEAMQALGGSTARPGLARGMSSVCNTACASGRRGKDGTAGQSAKSKRWESWSRRWA
jgi:hypothetical protein